MMNTESDEDPVWLQEMRDHFYGSFMFMIINHDSYIRQKVKFPHDCFLYDYNQEMPTERDLCTWVALVVDYASKHKGGNLKWEKWSKEVGGFNKLNLDISSARLHLSTLVTQHNAQYLYGYDLKDKLSLAGRKAYKAGFESGAANQIATEIQQLDVVQRKQFDELSIQASSIDAKWNDHVVLCHFYNDNHLRGLATYPPAENLDAGPLILCARAYYQLSVRSPLSRYRQESSGYAVTLCDQAIKMDKKSALAYALKSVALKRAGKDRLSASAAKKALKLDNDNEFINNLLKRNY